MKKYRIYFILSCLVFLVFGSCSLKQQDVHYIEDENINAVRDSIIGQFAGGGFKVSYQDAINKKAPMLELMHSIKEEEEDLIFFEDMYDSFQALSDYDSYKQYSQIYLPLVPAIYAVREKNKDMYLQFYGFLFDQVEEEGLYFNEIVDLVGQRNDVSVKEGFLQIFGEHYEKVVGGEFHFDSSFGDDPLQIAITNDTLEQAQKHCDVSQVSGGSQLSKLECYDYVYQYRATNQNKLCDKVSGEYQKRICKGYLEYISR